MAAVCSQRLRKRWLAVAAGLHPAVLQLLPVAQRQHLFVLLNQLAAQRQHLFVLLHQPAAQRQLVLLHLRAVVPLQHHHAVVLRCQFQWKPTLMLQ